MRLYTALRVRLRRELGVDPDFSLVELAGTIHSDKLVDPTSPPAIADLG